MRSLVIGTAGHINHGKTALVRALTGIDTDRLAEEKARGITIELGFAHLALPGGIQASVVDVPGHERFVKNMVAGTSGIDLVLMVIAADEGVMPQTREHLDICTLLEVKVGVVALNKVDLVSDPDWLKMVVEDARKELAGTFLEDAPIVPVSSKTGAGLDELKAVLAAAASKLEHRAEDAPAFLAVDRAFSMHGFGTVVTGTLVSGTLEVDQAVDAIPDPAGHLKNLKIRGLEVHGQAEQRVFAGRRLAVNLSGVERAELTRGQVLVAAGTLEPGTVLEGTLRLVPGARPVHNRLRATLHTGTTHAEAQATLIGQEDLAPGERAFVRLRLSDPVAVMPGQRYILRGFNAIGNRGTTVGGGQILSIFPHRKRKEAERWRADLAMLESGSLAERLLVILGHAQAQGLDRAALSMRLGLGARALERELGVLLTQRKVIQFDREHGRYVSAEALARLLAQAQEILTEFHQKNPLLPGLGLEQLRGSLADGIDPRLFRRLLDEGIATQTLAVEGEAVRLATHAVRLDASGSELEGKVARIFERAALSPPRPDEVVAEVKRPEPEVKKLLQHMARTGALTYITQDMYVWTAALTELRQKLVAHLKEKGGIDTQAFKALVGASRKHAIPLAEFFDREKTTLRVGDKRQLRKKDG